RSGPRAGGDPQCRSVAGLVNAKIKASEADSSEHRHAYTFGTASAAFATRDEPDPDSGENKAEHVAIARNALREGGRDSRNRSAQNSRHRCNQPHISAG